MLYPLAVCGHRRIAESLRTSRFRPFYSTNAKQAMQFLSESGRPGHIDEEVDRTVRLS